jgi:hypothetical protein
LFDISLKNLLTSIVAFGNRAGKWPILTNVKCCSCIFYKFSSYQIIIIKCTIQHLFWFVFFLITLYTISKQLMQPIIPREKYISWNFGIIIIIFIGAQISAYDLHVFAHLKINKTLMNTIITIKLCIINHKQKVNLNLIRTAKIATTVVHLLLSDLGSLKKCSNERCSFIKVTCYASEN